MKFVEESVRLEHSASPNKPIYLVGDTFGGCLALAVAARNPTIDLMLVLSNPGQKVDACIFVNFQKLFFFFPSSFSNNTWTFDLIAAVSACLLMHLPFLSATSFGKSQLKTFLTVLDTMPKELHITFPYLLSFVVGMWSIYTKKIILW